MAVRLELESHPENVALVRSALSGIARAVRLGEEQTADLKTAISEACNNVALHAYDGGSGPMVVEIDGSEAGIHASVIDHGSGIRRISSAEDRMGLGLAVISALADSSEFRHPEGGGTEVRMFFATGHHGVSADEFASNGAHGRQLPRALARASDEILVYCTPVKMTRYVLGPMVQALAAASNFSVDKISDLREINNAISSYIEETGNGAVSVAIASSPRRLSMTTGPLPSQDPARAEAALAAVVDTVSAEAQQLRIELLDRSRDPA